MAARHAADAGSFRPPSGPPTGPPAGSPRERLRVGGTTIVALVGVVVGAGLVVTVVSSASRVLGWLAAAALLAAVLHPIVERLATRVPRGLAVLTVLLGMLGLVGLVGYGLVSELDREFHRIERVAPQAARNIERSTRFGSAASEFRLAERTQRFVDELPRRLQGGSQAELLRTSATRSVAFLAGGVLTAFLLLHGQRLVTSALAQIGDEARRRRLSGVLGRAYRRARVYVAGRIAFSVAVAVVTGTAGRLFDVPGPRVLGLFCGVLSLVPNVGVVIGALPVVVLAGGTPGGVPALWVLAFFLVAQAGEAWAFRRTVERRTVHVGPFVSMVAGMAGFELYGIGGALGLVVLAVFALALADELAPTDADTLELADLTS